MHSNLFVTLPSFDAAHDTLVGVELMHMLKKGQLVVEEGENALTAAEQFYALAASSPLRQGQLSLHDLLSKICDIYGPAPRCQGGLKRKNTWRNRCRHISDLIVKIACIFGP
jgi:hypothetical protein